MKYVHEWICKPIIIKDQPKNTTIEVVGYYEPFGDYMQVHICIAVNHKPYLYKSYSRKQFNKEWPSVDDIRKYFTHAIDKIINKYSKLTYSAFSTKFELLKSKVQ
jgi:hypothetical protein